MHWLEELLKTYGQLKVAAEASNLEDNRQVLAMDRAVVESHHRRHLGPAFEPPPADSEEDMIHIGDRHDHHPAHPPAAGRLLQWLTVLGLLSAGAGGGLGGAWLLSQLIKPPQTAPPVGPDRDTLFELRLGPPRSNL